MSTVFSPSKARVTPAQPAQRQEPKLRVVYGAPFRPPRMPFVIFVVSLLAAGLVGLLLLNTELQRGTFQVTALNQQADQLRDQQEQLERQVRTLESPQNLADRSLRMGMVPNPNPVFLRLSDGKVLGVPAEGRAGTGTAMFGPDTPTGTKPTPPVTTKPPAVKPATPKPPAATTKPPATTTKPPAATTKPPASTTKPPVKTTKPPATTGTQTPTGGCSDDGATGQRTATQTWW
jgi:outer membrane biosynthesis protein TonB